MTTTGKIILGVIVAVIIIGGAGYYWYTSMQSVPSTAVTAATTTDQNSVTQNTASAPAGGTSGTNANALPSGSSNTDASLNQDTAAIDAQMSGLSTDNASANQSVNDQPITQ